ncbi:unnamed protein product [Microthlaspi erraticum]|uniref:Uncharacterized protein n=1 Tax=Microthlaspi erraticum TaxID=1685480 RepID=A0A6D2KCZ2_9BRAS|nr:unnamed protein product [Microthlaspi erraticum]
MGQGAWRDLAHGSSSTGYAKEEGRSHLEDQLDRPLDQPVEFLNSTGQASTRSSWKSKSNPKNAAWAVKELNFNLKTAAERRLIQLNELEEIRHLAYENTKIYKEKTKALHDRKIVPKSFAANDQVLLFNSRLKLFPGKLRSRWSGPFKIKEVKPYGAVVLWDPSGGDFTVNGQRLKPYLANSEKGVEEIIPLADAPQE